MEPIWTPDPATVAASALARFAERVGQDPADYAALWRWSVSDLDGFWRALWDFAGLRFAGDPGTVLADARMPGAVWFPDVRLNYVAQVFRGRDPDRAAIVAVGEDGAEHVLTWQQLEREVGALAATLRDLGVRRGDRVAGYLPNGAHAVVAFLATASLGAVWACCAQDYAGSAAVDRFGQLEPVALVAADGYRFNGRRFDRRDQVRALVEAMPSVRAVITVAHLGLDAPRLDVRSIPWDEAVAGDAPVTPEPVPFDHPLWVLFSSGTTGKPKGIVHGHGGVVLEHVKALRLQTDVGPDDRFCWYTSTSWVMWNLQASGLLVGATIVLYDGSPAFPGPGRLWEFAAEQRISVLGTSAGYLQISDREDLRPGGDLSALRHIGSTGSTLPAAPYHWVRRAFGPAVPLVSISGGTDVAAAFCGGAPNLPVWPGEISAPNLGVALDAFGPDGRPVRATVGELVITAPMPSMPVAMWNDPDGSRLRDTYYSTFPGVWRHGDWVTITDRGSVVIHGRSDSTLNRRGVRLGSADIYAVVEKIPGIRESLVIGAEQPDGGYWMPLFVVLEGGVELDDALRDRIRAEIRDKASPRHVPDEVIQVDAVPHTRTGKKLEVPVKRLLQGASQDDVLQLGAVDDPDSLRPYAELARQRAARR